MCSQRCNKAIGCRTRLPTPKEYRMPRRTFPALTAILLIALFIPLNGADKNDKKNPATSSVDAGTFGILVNGHRVATETFHVDQQKDGSSISSELKFDDSSVRAVQNSEMTMQPNGLLKKYIWKEVTPGKAQIIVEPQDEQFMVERVSENGGTDSKDVVHPLAPETSILDDNF